MNYREEYKNWCTDAYFDEDTKAELKALEGNEAEIEDRFYKKLEFGTGVRQHRDWQIIFSHRTDRKKVWQSLTIPESCHRNLQEKQHCV